jgi:hypothetical protein
VINHRVPLSLLAVGLITASCGGGDDPAGAPTTRADIGAYGAQVASYDLAADGPQRFLVGLIGADNGLIVGGEVTLDFRYFGLDATETADLDDGELLASDVPAKFTPVAGGLAPPEGDGPRVKRDEEGVGVYEAMGVLFDEPGFWSVIVRAEVGGSPVEVSTAFEVAAEHRIVAAGEPAPRTANLLPGDPDAPPKAVDSRADDDGSVPDAALHEITVADAIATGRPTVVVVSTPVFCVSRFCGPITDSIEDIAGAHEGQANFVHIEVWKDFEGNVLNNGAAEWIYPSDEVDPFEPWVFLIDGAGTVVRRWDNVANAGDVEVALASAIG